MTVLWRTHLLILTPNLDMPESVIIANGSECLASTVFFFRLTKVDEASHFMLDASHYLRH